MASEAGILQYHEPESWSFYVYGEDDDGDPLFSFWMNITDETGICIYDRNAGAGKWLGTVHDDEEYSGQPPSEDLKDVIRECFDPDMEGVRATRVANLPDHERYFFQVIHGTIEQKGKAAPALLRFIEDVIGTEVTIA